MLQHKSTEDRQTLQRLHAEMLEKLSANIKVMCGMTSWLSSRGMTSWLSSQSSLGKYKYSGFC
jgi:hypothetical protein